MNSNASLATNLMEIYDPVANTLTTGSNSLVARGFSASAVINNKFYITGGNSSFFDPVPDKPALEVYDPGTGLWSTNFQPMPVGIEHPVGFAINGKFYVTAGYIHSQNQNNTNLYIYDPSLNSWTTGAPMPAPRGAAFGGVINGLFYLGGGDGTTVNGNGTTNNPVFFYDPVQNNWSTGAAEPAPQNLCASAVVNGVLYVTGGYLSQSGSAVNSYATESYIPNVTNLPFAYITNNGSIAITAYLGSNAAVVIPATINGLPVTRLFDGGGFNAIPGFLGLSSVIIPDSVTNIDANAFAGCASLTNISLGNGVTAIEDLTFYDCFTLAGITIPNSVASIGVNAFFSSGLTRVTIPNSVTSIGNGAFDNCPLTNVLIGTGLSTLGAAAFFHSGLTAVTIPQNVTNIGIGAFADCLNLTNITVASGNPAYISVNGVLFNQNQTTLLAFPAGLGGSYAISNSVVAIADDGFYGAATLQTVVVPGSVVSIGSDAFAFCTQLTAAYFLGNAPAATNDYSVFMGNLTAIVYILPTTTGWGAMFDGLVTSVIQPPAPAVGMGTYGGQPAVFFPTATGTNYVLQMTTNLNPPVNWVTATNGLPISGIIVTNPGGAAFFRLVNP